MILLTSRETGLPAFVWVKELQSIETHGGSSPYSRLFLKNEKQQHVYTLDVLEDKKEIQRRIKKERLDPGCESRPSLLAENTTDIEDEG